MLPGVWTLLAALGEPSVLRSFLLRYSAHGLSGAFRCGLGGEGVNSSTRVVGARSTPIQLRVRAGENGFLASPLERDLACGQAAAAAIARTSRLWEALRAAADADPRAAAMLDDVRAERRREFERSAQTLVDLGAAPADSVPTLVRKFFAFASHEV